MQRNKDSLIASLRGHASAITSVACNKQNDIIISGDQNGVIHVWKNALKTRRSDSQFHTVPQDTKSNISRHFMTLQLKWFDECKFLSQNRHCMVTVYDVTRAQQVISCIKYSDELVQASFCRMSVNCERQLCALPRDKSIAVYSVNELNSNPIILTYDVNLRLGVLMAVDFHHSDNNILYGAFENGQVYQWDIRSPDTPVCVKQSISYEPTLCMKQFSLKNETNTIVTGTTGKTITFQSIDNSQYQSTFDLMNEGVNDIQINKNGRIMFTAGWDHRIRAFELKKKQSTVESKPLAIYKNHTATVNCLDLNLDESILVSGSQDERLCLWSIHFNQKAKQ
jgi:WD40 repeat protein